MQKGRNGRRAESRYGEGIRNPRARQRALCVAAGPRIAYQREAKMIMIGRATRIQLDRLAKQMNRRVIFLSFKTSTSLLVIHLGHLGGGELGTTLGRADYCFGDR